MTSLIFWLLLAIAILAIVAKWLRLPYPIAFVIGGGALALVPGLPAVQLQADLVFLIFLPPLLFGNAWTTDWQDFKTYLMPILMLATGAVVFTTTIVALVAHSWIGLPLAAAFVLGAIVSPPDSVATEAIAEGLGLPRRITAILSGESLINDASALVVYRFAVAAVVTGTFSLWAAGWQFLYVSVVGIATGFIVALAITWVQEFLNRSQLGDDVISVTLTLITPFLCYLPAEAIQASGVLATVTAGMVLSRKAERILNSEARIAAAGVWKLLFFTFNGVVFILIGLQLRSILAQLTQYAPGTLVAYGLGISAVVIVVRFVWIFPSSYGRRLLFPRYVEREGPRPPWQYTFVLSWAGMRGIVSLAAALALPSTVAGGQPFVGRELILFLAFCVIVVTLVGQGLTLPPLIRALRVVDTDDSSRREAEARIVALRAAREHLRGLEAGFDTTTHWEVAGRIYSDYDQRIEHFRQHLGDAPTDDSQTKGLAIRHSLEREALDAERAAIGHMRRRGEIPDDIFRRLEWEIDLAEARLE